MSKIYNKKIFILAILSISILVFCMIYKNTPNGVSKTIIDIADIAATSEIDVSNEFDKILQVTQNEFIQFPIRFINSLVSIYIEAILLLIVFKIVNIFNNKKYKITLKDLVDTFYLSLYVIAINLFIQTIYMFVVGQAIDYTMDIYTNIYNLLFNILNFAVIIYFLKKRHDVIVIPSIYSLILVVGQSILAVGGI